jgi:UDP-glucose 4-epimerase
LKYLVSGGAGGCFNLGTGRGYSVRQILSQICTETGKKTPFAIKPRRQGDPPFLVADPARAKEILGFVPRYSDPSTIVGSAWRWHQRVHRAKK